MTRPRAWMLALAAAASAGAGPGAAAPPSPPPDAVRRTLGDVFERPEFQPREARGGGALFKALRDFFEWLGGLRAGAPVLFWVLLLGCVGALVLLVALIVWQVGRALGSGTEARRAEAETRRRGLAADHRGEAGRLAAAGEYAEAVRHLFLSLIYRLDESGRVGLNKAYTNHEYLELLGDRLPSPGSLKIIVDTLDDCWYGQRACRAEQYQTCLAVYEQHASS
ncbi:Uncharacterized protein OS=Roseiflexus castenholzii (strain DSM 13941 / HLO8) GN=Rcas_2512 PE=4 SV=1 [Gemmataceae bacterium]|nr:Uncharacterized protein OS=Roseiflexus castenholzii (strain DSM 13941 / HLO8) GN=Rcas_2512 PE=4 SV=1 [Gemmataceae bacterium]VTU00963.1 Uncharacterized protein OS=Roseiflexus castenholzii (strain DSM 13941 / HLO8) GN=Rcas_2512 PE=4 SV=1 [Gemmataceae bacterium]